MISGASLTSMMSQINYLFWSVHKEGCSDGFADNNLLCKELEMLDPSCHWHFVLNCLFSLQSLVYSISFHSYLASTGAAKLWRKFSPKTKLSSGVECRQHETNHWESSFLTAGWSIIGYIICNCDSFIGDRISYHLVELWWPPWPGSCPRTWCLPHTSDPTTPHTTHIVNTFKPLNFTFERRRCTFTLLFAISKRNHFVIYAPHIYWTTFRN